MNSSGCQFKDSEGQLKLQKTLLHNVFLVVREDKAKYLFSASCNTLLCSQKRREKYAQGISEDNIKGNMQNIGLAVLFPGSFSISY